VTGKRYELATRRSTAALSSGERRRRRQRRHALALLVAMAALLALCGWVIAGAPGVALSVAIGALMLVALLRLPPSLVLNALRARPASPWECRELLQIAEGLAERAGLGVVPRLYRIEERLPLAFTIGSGDEATIVLSSGLLAELAVREVAAVVAHEIVHVRNGDIAMMQLASAVGLATRMMTRAGLFLILFGLLANLLSLARLPLAPLLLITIAPIAVTLLQLVLARSREGEADLEAAELMGDPQPLASALIKIRRREEALLRGMFPYAMPLRVPPLLRDHPVTEERIRRLLAMADHDAGTNR